MRTHVYVCDFCKTEVTRPVARGQRPRWCPDCRAKNVRALRVRDCAACGKRYQGWGDRFCSKACSAPAVAAERQPRRSERIPRTSAELLELQRLQWSPIRRAIERADYAAVLDAVRRDCVVNDEGCWIWQRKVKDGYAYVALAGKSRQVHRLVLEARMGAPLGSQPAHHICAVSRCVNPNHLQPVTHRENVAEMLARNAYLARIKELEDALREVVPGHALLARVPVR